MKLKPRWPDTVEMVAQAILFFFLVRSVGGFVKAMIGEDCDVKPGPGCYPWGPGGEYHSQGHQLLATAVIIPGLILAMLPPFFRQGWKLNLVLMLWIALFFRVYGPELLLLVLP
jgi:hypothetical protein